MKQDLAPVSDDECIQFLKTLIEKKEVELKFRVDSQKVWADVTDEMWRAVGCMDSKEKRIKTSNGHGRIAHTCRLELRILRAILDKFERKGFKK